ncbi:hypothetical protein [Virgibacillus sp. YIM 98842]|uniref:hypothetical protein n=1 Tax=Virgibacillus sp. YIM 98842 TaxID=2663533 RepID=UPI0013DD64B3|nr:hypothetical protein [Virgibacillus sp. YIM 98842]
MQQLALLYLACILAGFGLANLPISSVISAEIANFFSILGGLAIIIFSLAVLYLGLKTLFKK